MYRIETTIEINQSPEAVWSVLTNFDKYEEWNQFISSFKGDLVEGKIVSVSLGGMNFSPILLKVEPNRKLIWLGKLLFKGLFDGQHEFIITDLGNGKIRFDQNENFRGLLLPFLKSKLKRDIIPQFEQMNLDLKRQVELNA